MVCRAAGWRGFRELRPARQPRGLGVEAAVTGNVEARPAVAGPDGARAEQQGQRRRRRFWGELGPRLGDVSPALRGRPLS